MTRSWAAILLVSTAGCAGQPVMQPADTPALYRAVSEPAMNCSVMTDEVIAIDRGLGSPAAETPPREPAGAWARVGDYGRDLVVQTVIGPLQPVIQTVRAIANSEDKAAQKADGHERALVRRAYLLGAMDASGCPRPSSPPAVAMP